jgi:integrase
MALTYKGKTYRGITRTLNGFRFRYTDQHGREHRILCSTIDEAILLYHKNHASQRHGGLPAPVAVRRSRVTFREIAQDALRYADKHKRSAQHDHWRMKKLVEWFGNMRADALTARDIAEKFENQAWKPATWNRHRALLSMTYRLAMRDGKASQNPARLLPQKPERNARLRFLSRDEEQRLRQAILERHPDRLAEFDLALQTGLRVSEQYGARWEHVDWQQRQLTIPLDKSGRTSHASLNEAAIAALASLRARTAADGSLICGGVKRPRKWFTDCLQAASVEQFTWHGLRHTFASRLVMSGADLRTVAELLRDTTLAMVMRYAHLAPDFRLQAVQRMQEQFTTTSASRGNESEPRSGTRSGTPISEGASSVH